MEKTEMFIKQLVLELFEAVASPLARVVCEEYPGIYSKKEGTAEFPVSFVEYDDFQGGIRVPSAICFFGAIPEAQGDAVQCMLNFEYFFVKFTGEGYVELDADDALPTHDDGWQRLTLEGYFDDDDGPGSIVLPPLDLVGVSPQGDLTEARLVANPSRDKDAKEAKFTFEIAYRLKDVLPDDPSK